MLLLRSHPELIEHFWIFVLPDSESHGRHTAPTDLGPGSSSIDVVLGHPGQLTCPV